MASTALSAPLVIRFGAFGDMVLLIPMLKVLQQRYGQPCDLVSSGGWTPPLMQRVPACATVRVLTSRRAPYWLNRSQRELVHWLRGRPAGPVYVFEPDDKSHWLLRRGGIDPGWICSLRDLPRLSGENILHHAVRLGRQTPAALASPGSFRPLAAPDAVPDARPVLGDADRSDCHDWMKAKVLAGCPLVLLQPGNKRTMRRGDRQRASNVKYWPESSWARVVRGVRETLPHGRVLLCGSPAEREQAEAIKAAAGGDGVIVVTDELPIPRLLALQEIAHSMISVDTGPAHAAAAMGCPLVVMFARIDPQLYAPTPTSAAVRLVTPEPSDAPMTNIAPETVITAWRELPPRPPA